MIEVVLANSEMISRIAGITATVLFIFSYFSRKRIWFFLFQVIGCVMITTSYLVKLNFFGSLAYVLAGSRMLIFAVFEKKKKDVPWWLVFTILSINILTCVLAWGGIYDLVMLAGLISYTLCCKIKNGITMRLMMLLPLVTYCVYPILTNNLDSLAPSLIEFFSSIGGVVTELLLRKGISIKRKNKDATTEICNDTLQNETTVALKSGTSEQE